MYIDIHIRMFPVVCFLLMILIALKIKLLVAFQLNMEEMSVLTMKRDLEKNGEEIINSMRKQVIYLMRFCI